MLHCFRRLYLFIRKCIAQPRQYLTPDEIDRAIFILAYEYSYAYFFTNAGGIQYEIRKMDSMFAYY